MTASRGAKPFFPFWMDNTVQEVTRQRLLKEIAENGSEGEVETARNALKAMGLLDKLAFFLVTKPGVISHTTPFYEKVLEVGLNGMIEEARRLEMAAVTALKEGGTGSATGEEGGFGRRAGCGAGADATEGSGNRDRVEAGGGGAGAGGRRDPGDAEIPWDRADFYRAMQIAMQGIEINDLNDAMKEELIIRTQYGLENGKAVPMDKKAPRR